MSTQEFRRLITLMESVPRFTRAFVQQVNNQAELHLGREIEDEPIDEDDIREWLSTHRKYFKGGKATVHRVMRLPQEFIDNLHPGAELGQHWTIDLDSLEIDGLDHQGQYPDGDLYVFSGVVTTRDIAWDLTLAYNIEFPHENEVFVSMRGSVTLASIREIDLYGSIGEVVRPDLTGKVFRV